MIEYVDPHQPPRPQSFSRPEPASARPPSELGADHGDPSTSWDPDRYLQFSSQRGRPFTDLIARIGVVRPSTVIDLGCGPGNATEQISDRWPDAAVLGLDNSAEMIKASALRARPGRLAFIQADLRDWRAGTPVDVVISNAALQWVPDHIRLLPNLIRQLTPEGCLAFAVPGNFGAPSHTLLAELQRSPRWVSWFSGTQFRPAVHEPAEYWGVLSDAGAVAEVWETTYYYVLDGPDGVLDFISGTALRPVLRELGGARTDLAASFLADYGAALLDAYPVVDLAGRPVQILPYRRIFALAQPGPRVDHSG